jgi:hypothetical protein
MPAAAEVFVTVAAVATPVHIFVQGLPLVSEALFFPFAELFRHGATSLRDALMNSGFALGSKGLSL